MSYYMVDTPVMLILSRHARTQSLGIHGWGGGGGDIIMSVHVHTILFPTSFLVFLYHYI